MSVSQLKSFNLLIARTLIGGQPSPSVTGRTFAVLNPADGSLLADVPDSGAEDANAATNASGYVYRGDYPRSGNPWNCSGVAGAGVFMGQHCARVSGIETRSLAGASRGVMTTAGLQGTAAIPDHSLRGRPIAVRG